MYECCKEDTLSTVLAESYALAGLMMQVTVYFVWLVVVPGYKKIYQYEEVAPDKYEDEEAEPLARMSADEKKEATEGSP